MRQDRVSFVSILAMAEDDQVMSRLERLTTKFNALKLVVTETLDGDVNNQLDTANREFAAYVEDWNFLTPQTQQDYRCNYLGVQNDFHYAAGLLLTRVCSDNKVSESENDGLNSVEEKSESENSNNPSQMAIDGSGETAPTPQQGLNTAKNSDVDADHANELGNAAAKPQFGTFEGKNDSDSSAVTFAAANSVTPSDVVEKMDVQETADKTVGATPNSLPYAEPLVVKLIENPTDRAPTKPLEMPAIVATSNAQKNKAKPTDVVGQTFASLSFEEKKKIMKPIIDLQKVDTVDEATLNLYLVALTTVKESMRSMGMVCDVATEHWIMMIVLGTLDAESINWWNLLMKSASPAIEILSEFLATRVENLKAKPENKPFRIPKRPPTADPAPSTEKRSRSRSKSQPRSTGAIPKRGNQKASGGSRLRSPTSHLVQPDCRYCATVGHVVANCPVFKGDTPEDREANLVRKRLCKICLLPHQKGECKKEHMSCEVCRRPHHPFLHHRVPNPTKLH